VIQVPPGPPGPGTRRGRLLGPYAPVGAEVGREAERARAVLEGALRASAGGGARGPPARAGAALSLETAPPRRPSPPGGAPRDPAPDAAVAAAAAAARGARPPSALPGMLAALLGAEPSVSGWPVGAARAPPAAGAGGRLAIGALGADGAEARPPETEVVYDLESPRARDPGPRHAVAAPDASRWERHWPSSAWEGPGRPGPASPGGGLGSRGGDAGGAEADGDAAGGHPSPGAAGPDRGDPAPAPLPGGGGSVPCARDGSARPGGSPQRQAGGGVPGAPGAVPLPPGRGGDGPPPAGEGGAGARPGSARPPGQPGVARPRCAPPTPVSGLSASAAQGVMALAGGPQVAHLAPPQFAAARASRPPTAERASPEPVAFYTHAGTLRDAASAAGGARPERVGGDRGRPATAGGRGRGRSASPEGLALGRPHTAAGRPAPPAPGPPARGRTREQARAVARLSAPRAPAPPRSEARVRSARQRMSGAAHALGRIVGTQQVLLGGVFKGGGASVSTVLGVAAVRGAARA